MKMPLSYDEKVLHFVEQMEMMRKLDALPAQNGIRASAQASMNLINLYSREIERVEKAEESLAAYEEGVDPEDPLAVECNAYANLYREHDALKRQLAAFIERRNIFIVLLIDAMQELIDGFEIDDPKLDSLIAECRTAVKEARK